MVSTSQAEYILAKAKGDKETFVRNERVRTHLRDHTIDPADEIALLLNEVEVTIAAIDVYDKINKR